MFKCKEPGKHYKHQIEKGKILFLFINHPKCLYNILGSFLYLSNSKKYTKLRYACVLSCSVMFNYLQLFATPWTVAHQAPLSTEFSRQECWSGLPLPTPEDLPDPGIKLASPAQAGGFFTTSPLRKPKLGYTEEQFKIASCTDLHK